MRDFEYFEPSNIAEAVSLLVKYNGQAKLMAGGTDVVVRLKHDSVKPKYIVNIGSISDLDYITVDDKKGIRIGALTTMRALEKSQELQEACPILSQAASLLGNPTIRNVATIGGNICNASPAADTIPPLVVLSAKAKLVGPKGERIVSIQDFCTGPGCTICQTGEVLTEIQVPVPPANTRSIYLKHAARGLGDLAIVGVAVVATIESKDRICKDVKIALGAVAPTPIRAFEAEKVIRGQKITQSVIEKCAEAARDEASPISDVRSSAEYRKILVKVYVKKALSEMVA